MYFNILITTTQRNFNPASGVVRLCVNAGYFSITTERVTSPNWGLLPPSVLIFIAAYASISLLPLNIYTSSTNIHIISLQICIYRFIVVCSLLNVI